MPKPTKCSLSSKGNEEAVEHGVTVIATGGAGLEPAEYSYGKDERILTSLALDRRFMDKDPSLKDIESP